MGYSIILRLGKGSLEEGFVDVEAQLKTPDQQAHPLKVAGSLPPCPTLRMTYRKWQEIYRELCLYRQQTLSLDAATRLELNIDPGTVEAVSVVEFNDVCQQLQDQLNDWLAASSFQRIENKLRTQLSTSGQVQVHIEAAEASLQQLPWHLWQFFEDYPQASLSLSMPEYQPPAIEPRTRKQVRILAIIGDQRGVDVAGDLQALQQLPGADVTVVKEPSRHEFEDHLWDDEGWDILFYGGHSQTEQTTGRLFLNPQESLTLDEFHSALRRAINRGVQLAIFNSCDGLGLAAALAQLQIPAVIVMREPVPNRVAVTFLQQFLAQYGKGRPCFQAVRDAQERLQGLEDQFACASWMPVMLQNPSVNVPTWADLRRIRTDDARQGLFRVGLLGGLGAALTVMGLGALSLLQPLELVAYDGLLRLRPPEPLDERLLIVKITPAERASLVREGQPALNYLPEPVLGNLLERLQADLKPRVIGLDIAHRTPTSNPALKRAFQQSEVIAGCGETSQAEVIAPPPDIPKDAFRIGFITLWFDPDQVLRRVAYEITPSSAGKKGNVGQCDVQFSMPLLAALTYLRSLDIDRYGIERTEQDDLLVGDVELPTLNRDTGGYQFSEMGGWEMMLNYRAGGQVSETVMLTEVLEGKLSQEKQAKLQGRIVLIGTDHESDHHPTPYDPNTPGVEIHAHAISQVLSGVMDNRPFITSWHQGVESLWIGGWGIVGGLLVWVSRRKAWLGGSLVLAIGLVGGAAFLLLCQGVWVPVVAPWLAIGLASGGVYVYWQWRSSSRRS